MADDERQKKRAAIWIYLSRCAPRNLRDAGWMAASDRRVSVLFRRKRKSNPIYLEPGKHDEVREWQMETREHVHRG